MSASNSTTCDLDLPHSPGSRASSPSPPLMRTDECSESLSSEDQAKVSLLQWFEMRKTFKGLVREHQSLTEGDLAKGHGKGTQGKKARKTPPSSPPRDPKRQREDYR